MYTNQIQLILKYKFTFFIGFFCILIAAHAKQNHSYGALAVDSPQGDRWGYSYNHSDAKSAEMRALKECGPDCTIVVSFDRGCAAYAASQFFGSTAYGWGKSESATEAKSIALSECNARGSMCKVRVWACSSN